MQSSDTEIPLIERTMQVELGLEDPLGNTEATREVAEATRVYNRARTALKVVVTHEWKMPKEMETNRG